MGAGSRRASEQERKDFRDSFKSNTAKECKKGCYLKPVYDGHFLNTHEPYQIAECLDCKRHTLRTGNFIQH